MSAEVISGIDHLIIAVRDLDRAAATYRRLGFTLSRRAAHSAHMGTANHTVMLERDYFELLAVLAPTEANARWRGALADGEGLAGFAAATSSAAAAGAAWRNAGLAVSDILAFSRGVERADGIRMEARFEIVALSAQAVPAMSIFACAQLTRDAVWLPELLKHPNTLARSASSPSQPRIRSWRRKLGRARCRARWPSRSAAASKSGSARTSTSSSTRRQPRVAMVLREGSSAHERSRSNSRWRTSMRAAGSSCETACRRTCTAI
jgi:catechol 2,3-dioxygenase-like lactoylglutathione lyase family enzyme